MTSQTQTLKSVLESRVRLDQAQRIAHSRLNLGEGATCSMGGMISHDVYGRPVTANTLNLNDSACSHYTGIDAKTYLAYENNQRPHIPICSAGLRTHADLMGNGRDLNPSDVYGQLNDRGRFQRLYPTLNNAQPHQDSMRPRTNPYERRMKPWDGSMDAQSHRWSG